MQAFKDKKLLFICQNCYSGMDGENNKPLISVQCIPTIKLCTECVRQLKHELRNANEKICNLCKTYHKINFEKEGDFFAQDFSFKDSLDQLIKSQQIALRDIQRLELKIGMFPEKVIIEFLENFYFKKIPFFDKTRKIESINL